MSWQTVESDPGVFSELVESWGVRNVEFHESLGVDADSLRAASSGAPLYGVVFLFKVTDRHRADAERAGGRLNPDAPVYFARQTVNDACATQALLSLCLNVPDLDVGEHLNQLREFTAALPPDLRGDSIGSDEFLLHAHNHMTRPVAFVSDPSAARPPQEDAFHYVAYVPVEGHLYELDGLQGAPLDHGELGDDFVEAVAGALQRRIALFDPSELHFAVLVASPDLRTEYSKHEGSADLLEQEEAKHAKQRRENALRRQPYTGLAIELLKQMAQASTTT